MEPTPDFSGSILKNGTIDLGLLERLSAPPSPFSTSGFNFWEDPYIADQLMESFLDPMEHEPSRQEPYVSLTVEAIADAVRLKGPASASESEHYALLDLGSGAGQYDEAFAERGFAVTGVDYCRPAVEHARESAGDLPIEYHLQDIRTFQPKRDHYAVVSIIYGTFGVLSPAEQSVVLERAREALLPGGLLVFDVFTDRYVRNVRIGDGWHPIPEGGFWQSDSHLTLARVHRYPQGVSLERNVVIGAAGSYRVFDSWWKSFTKDEIVDLVRAHRFTEVETYGSIWKAPLAPRSEWIGIYCRKP